MESFYEQITNTFKPLKKQDITIILGDFNATVGHGRMRNTIEDMVLEQEMNEVIDWFSSAKNNVSVLPTHGFNYPLDTRGPHHKTLTITLLETQLITF